MPYKRFLIVFFVIVVLFSTYIVYDANAQDDALTGLEQCANVAIDMVCYGGGDVRAISAVEDALLPLNNAGATVNAADVRSVNIAGDGAVLWRLSAGTTQGVYALAFNGVTMLSTEAVSPTLSVTATGGVNVRGGPSTNFGVVAGLDAGEVVVANGRNTAGDWLRVNIPRDGQEPLLAWVYTPLFDVEGDVMRLDVIEDDAPGYSPMQVFTLQTREDNVTTGLLLRTASDTETARLIINGAEVQLRGTVFVRASDNTGLDVSVLNGMATVTAKDVTRRVYTGTRTFLALNDVGLVTEAPGDLHTVNSFLRRDLPFEVFPVATTPGDPLSGRGVELANQVHDLLPEMTDPALMAEDFPHPDLNNITVIELMPQECANLNNIPAGEPMFFQLGIGGNSTPEIAMANYTNQSATVTLDGMPLEAFYQGLTLHSPNNYGNRIWAMWVTTPGEHTVEVAFTFPAHRTTCTFTTPGW